MALTVIPRRALQKSAILNTVGEIIQRLRTAFTEAQVPSYIRRQVNKSWLLASTTDHQSDKDGPDFNENRGGSGTNEIDEETGTSPSGVAQPPVDESQYQDTSLDNDNLPRSSVSRHSTNNSNQSLNHQESGSFFNNSVVYGLYQRGKRFVATSWFYQWLTAEPEPDVIVIDLRETQTIGPILTILDRWMTQVQQDIIPAIPTATITRFSFWLRKHLRERPIRAASIVTAISANLGLLMILGGGNDPVSPEIFFLFGALLLAVRGFRSTTSWDEITATRWYQRCGELLLAAFKPPEPPETTASPRGRDDKRDSEPVGADGHSGSIDIPSGDTAADITGLSDSDPSDSSEEITRDETSH